MVEICCNLEAGFWDVQGVHFCVHFIYVAEYTLFVLRWEDSVFRVYMKKHDYSCVNMNRELLKSKKALAQHFKFNPKKSRY